MQLGLNFNKTHYDFKDLFNTGSTNKNAKRSFAAVLLPSLDVEYRFHNNNRFFANISRGFSNPSLEETLTPEGVINPDIEQEKGMNYEFGVELLLLQSQLWLNFTAYRMNINDLLVAQRIGEDEFIGKNAGSTRHQGIDLDMNYGIPLSESLKISPFLSYTYSDHSFIEFIDGANDFSGNPLTGVPKHRLNAGLRLAHTSSFYWNNTWQYVSKIPLTDSNILSSDSYSIFNTQLGYRLELSDQFGMGFELGVNNIFNTLYAQSVLINAVGFGGNEPRYFYPGNDRNFYTGIRLFYQL
jgi:iron complex outermembrane receptor protein